MQLVMKCDRFSDIGSARQVNWLVFVNGWIGEEIFLTT